MIDDLFDSERVTVEELRQLNLLHRESFFSRQRHEFAFSGLTSHAIKIIIIALINTLVKKALSTLDLTSKKSDIIDDITDGIISDSDTTGGPDTIGGSGITDDITDGITDDTTEGSDTTSDTQNITGGITDDTTGESDTTSGTQSITDGTIDGFDITGDITGDTTEGSGTTEGPDTTSGTQNATSGTISGTQDTTSDTQNITIDAALKRRRRENVEESCDCREFDVA
jgi:hypothetical protein